MRVGSAFVQTFGTQLLQSMASIATGVLIARALGPTGQGTYSVFAAGIGLGSTIATVGQFESNVLTSQGRATAGRVLLVRALLHGLIVLAVLLAVGPWISSIVNLKTQGLATVFAVVLALEVVALMARGINLGQHHVTAYNLATLIQRVGYLVAVAAGAALLGLTLVRVTLSWATAAALSILASAIWIWRRSDPVPLTWAGIRDGWMGTLGRGLRAVTVITLTLLLVRSDIWMLGRLLDLATVGQISVATYLAEWLWYIPGILASVLFAAAAADRGPVVVGQICRAARAVVLLVAPVTLVLLVIGRWLVVALYGQSYGPASWLFLILLPGMAAIALHLIVDSWFAGRGFPAISLWSVAVALAAKVGLNLLVVPHYGARGAAAVTSAVYLGLLTIKVVAFTRDTGVPVRNLLLPTAEDVRANLATVRTWLSSRLGRVTRV
ncbi:MAG: polysaccharide biosynthesis C-terminal domain-containing protein [Gemmatimonadota bacterium]